MNNISSLISEMCDGEADRRESCSLFALSQSNIHQLQFANEQQQTNKQHVQHKPNIT